jgi:competence protein ComEA
MKKDKMIKIGILLITFFLCGCLYSCQESQKTKVSIEEQTSDSIETVTTESKTETQSDKKEDTFIYVYICGEVQSPGVYQVEEGARLYQVVEMAGGILETASKNYLNLAECVTDGQKIVVPTIEEAQQLETFEEESSSGLVNINIANEETLTTLPGIGTSKAKSIIAYRESKGNFQSIEGLMEIEGIKEGVFSKIKDMITVK